MDEIVEANAGKRRIIPGLPYVRVLDGDPVGTSLLKAFGARDKKVFRTFLDVRRIWKKAEKCIRMGNTLVIFL